MPSQFNQLATVLWVSIVIHGEQAGRAALAARTLSCPQEAIAPTAGAAAAAAAQGQAQATTLRGNWCTKTNWVLELHQIDTKETELIISEVDKFMVLLRDGNS